MKPVRSIGAAELRGRCSEVLDRVARNGEAYVVTKRGRPVAKLVPIDMPAPRSLRGSVTFLTDIVEQLGDGINPRHVRNGKTARPGGLLAT